jgi:hypothetical protein
VKQHIYLCVAILLGIIPPSIPAEINGYLKHYDCLSLRGERELVEVGTVLQMRISPKLGDTSAYGGINFRFRGDDPRDGEISGVEAYVDLSLKRMDLRLGNQIVPWGRTDWLPITDVLNPWDFSVRSSEVEDLRIPVPAVRVEWYPGDFTVEAIWIPRFVPGVPPEDKLSKMLGELKFPPDSSPKIEEEGPSFKLQDTEFGLKINRSGSRLDASLCYFYGWKDMPQVDPSPLLDDGKIMLKHPRFHMFGGSFTAPIGDLLSVGEAALQKTVGGDTVLKYALGGTYRLTEEISLNLQLYQELPLDDEAELKSSLFGNLRVNLPDRYITFICIGRYNITDGDYFITPRLSYQPADAMTITLGAFLFGGDEKGEFGEMWRKSYAFLETKYSF